MKYILSNITHYYIVEECETMLISISTIIYYMKYILSNITHYYIVEECETMLISISGCLIISELLYLVTDSSPLEVT